MKKILLAFSILFSSHIATAQDKAEIAEKRSIFALLESLKADNNELAAAKAAAKTARSELSPQSHDLQKIKYADTIIQLEAAEKKMQVSLVKLQTLSPATREKLSFLIDFSKRSLMSKRSKPAEVPPVAIDTQLVALSNEYLFLESLSTRLLNIDYSGKIKARHKDMYDQYYRAIQAPPPKQAAILNGLEGGGHGETQPPENTGAEPLELDN